MYSKFNFNHTSYRFYFSYMDNKNLSLGNRDSFRHTICLEGKHSAQEKINTVAVIKIQLKLGKLL